MPRAGRAVHFFEEGLVHTKGRWARREFRLAGWQRTEIVEPVFGLVVWDGEWGCYRRLKTDVYIELGRKNGKSELAAGIALLLLVADDEESAEVYGCAHDVPQARKVFDVAARMVRLSATLSRRLTVREAYRRIVDERTASYYEVVPADAAGNLGHNPHGVILDEAIAQPDGRLWEAMTSAAGSRVQPLFLRLTTAGNDGSSWAAKEHEEAARVAADPKRAPHRFVYMRATPREADPWDEGNWGQANPALDDFLSREVLRREALEARNDPARENVFRQFRLCQWVSQVTRAIPLHVWDHPGNVQTVNEEQLVGRRAYGGLDLAATTDLASCAWLLPDGPDGPATVLWRYWMPEAMVPLLDRHLGGRLAVWARQGLVTVTPGDAVDYGRIHDDLDHDLRRFTVLRMGYDAWGAEPTRQWVESNGVDIHPIRQTYQGMSRPLKELVRLVKLGQLRHGGNPVTRWNVDSLEFRQDDQENIRPVKPKRGSDAARIDGVTALAMAIGAWLDERAEPSIYEKRGLLIL